MYTDPWLPPPLYPGTGGDEAWCIQSCPPCCDTLRRRYASKDYIEINSNVRKTFLRLMSNDVAPEQVNPKGIPIYIEIRKRGCATLIGAYSAFQRTLDGYVGFYWDALFNEAPPALYVGDVYIDCCYCFSVLFRIRACELVVDSHFNELATELCGMGECSMLDTIGEGVIGGLECEFAPESSECGLPAPYFETADPVPNSPICELPCNTDLSCEPAWRKPPDELSDCSTPVFSVTGDVLIGDI
jgi:hypothetical protein